MSLLELGPIIFGPKRDLIDYLQNKRLIALNMQCQRCSITMNNIYKPEIKVCEVMALAGDALNATSIRHDSFFS